MAVVSAVVNSRQTVHHKLIKHFQRADQLKRRAKKLNNPLHAQTIRSRLNSLNYCPAATCD
jgi:uncharacterized coiled-coil DUF342 family protein